MKKSTLILSFVLCLTLAYSQNVYKDFVDGSIYVKFSKSLLKEASRENAGNISLSKLKSLNKLVSKYGITRAYKPFYQATDDENLQTILKLEFTDKSKVNDIIDELSAIQGVEYAEKEHLNLSYAVPNDPMFASTTGSTHLNQINAQNAWNIFNGSSNITVAIIDNAVMWTHVDLVANTYTNTIEANGSTGVDDDGNGYIDDINGFDVAGNDGVATPTSTSQDHGTHCAGIAGATSNNSIGVASIGWNIKIIPVKCSYDNTTGSIINKGYEGIIYAVKAKAKIISCSWGNSSGIPSQSEQYVMDYAWNRGCIVICSAGNNGTSTQNYPGAYNHVYCVASVDASDAKSTISSYGSWVDIAAPGDNILSTVPYSGTPNYVTYSGTSMATPLVAGLAALMLSKSPNMTRTDVLNCISSTAANIYTVSANSSYSSGSLLGAGRIDAFAAMTCAATYSALPPIANFYAFLPNTCPNTSIPFYDSSLYLPTSWSWIFQGGTPATSTSSNPSVQWASAGTYSVSLTVSNVNGTNTKTKVSYVTVSNPGPPTFSEGFQGTQFLPVNWVTNNIGNDNIYWERTTTAGGFGTSTACAMFNNYVFNVPGDRDEMRTPRFDFSNVATARLRYDVAYARYDATNSDTLEVRMSSSCGTTWTNVVTRGGSNLATAPDQGGFFIPSSTQWRRDTFDISAQVAGQNNVTFGFLNHGFFGQPIYIDNINLVFPTPTLNANYSSTICVGALHTFTNTSLSSANYIWNFAGGSPASSTATNPSVSYSNPGTYLITLQGVNGTSTAQITRTITVITPQTINATASPSTGICANSQVTLNATGVPSFTWAGGPANTAYIVSPNATTTYTVSGGIGGCLDTKTIMITVVPSTVVVSITSNSSSLCAGMQATLNASGASSYTWTNGPSSSSFVVNPTITTTYSVTGETAGCKGNASSTINVLPTPLSTVSSSDVGCPGQCNGAVNASTSGGIGPFTYSIANSGTCSSLPCTNLCAGNYTLVTTGSNGCSEFRAFNVSGPPALQTVLNITNPSCGACSDGLILLNVSNSNAPLTYTWMPAGGNSPLASNLSQGCYTVAIQDTNSCITYTTACLTFGTSLGKLSLNSSLLIYPNPVQDILKIEFEGEAFDFVIYTTLGEFVLEGKANQTKNSIDLTTFASGVYFITVKSGDEVVRKKIVVE
jgi:serine protease